MRHKSLVGVLGGLGILALVAVPVYAIADAAGAKAMLAAMDSGKVTLSSAIAAAEEASKGKAVAAIAEMADDKLHVDVYVVSGDKLQRVEVDAAGKAGKPADAKEVPGGGHLEKKKPAPKGG